MALSDDKKAELRYSHYAETYSVIQLAIKSRDRFFIGILAVLAVMSFQIALPTQSNTAIAEFAQKQLGVQTTLRADFLGSVIWVVLLFFVVRYFQLAVGLERHYRYIHLLEHELNESYSGAAFTREGKFYLAHYPWFLMWISRFYVWVFPLILIAATSLKLASEARLPRVSLIPLVFDSLSGLLLITAAILYMVHAHLGR